MEASKVITYSLLAQIRNSGNFVNSSVEIFVPIVKYALYKLITQSGVYKGASITEISTWICQYFGLDFPPAVLEKILLKIGQEINTSEELKLQVYRDGSFGLRIIHLKSLMISMKPIVNKSNWCKRCLSSFAILMMLKKIHTIQYLIL